MIAVTQLAMHQQPTVAGARLQGKTSIAASDPEVVDHGRIGGVVAGFTASRAAYLRRLSESGLFPSQAPLPGS